MSHKALIVEDDRVWVDALRARLKSYGFRVYTASDAKEGRAQLVRGPFLLAVVDVSLVPGDAANRDGLRFAKDAWSRHSVDHFVMVSSFVDEKRMRSELGSKISVRFVKKSDLVAKLDRTVRDLTARERRLARRENSSQLIQATPKPAASSSRGKRYHMRKVAVARLKRLKRSPELSKKVFVVHGRDNGTKDAVARFLAALHLQPVILHEQPNGGKTLIEKFEIYADAAYAVILLTPDDRGALETEAGSMKPRARQNVVFEMGYFIGALGRDKVCGLTGGDIELPSDYSGVVYIPLDPNDAWKFKLIRELKAAGLAVDANVAF